MKYVVFVGVIIVIERGKIGLEMIGRDAVVDGLMEVTRL